VRCLSFLLLLLGSIPAFACQVTPRTTAPLVMQDAVPTLRLMVNGQPARFVLDTGAGRTVVSPDAVRRLGLPLDPWVGTTLEGVGGLQRHQDAVPQSIDLNGVPLRQAYLGAGFSLAVATLPVSAPVDGLLGRDLLESFDLDIDLSRLRLTLYTVQGCTGAFLPWPQQYRGAPAISGYRDALVFFSFLDARPLRTIVDTGAAASLLTASGAVRAGFPAVARDPYARLLGVGPRRVAARLHQFDTLSVAGVISPAPRLLVTDLLLAPLVDLVLGDEWLRSHRVWLSFATRQVFFASP
jgi:Aspartyl protease